MQPNNTIKKNVNEQNIFEKIRIVLEIGFEIIINSLPSSTGSLKIIDITEAQSIANIINIKFFRSNNLLSQMENGDNFNDAGTISKSTAINTHNTIDVIQDIFFLVIVNK
ncbi:hypothetical protein FACS189459_0640 [Bacilli bacterium]|nr:hypothetical protein FACS189459_0640 [Bacilli bacterium]